jgi:DNA polymerase-1
MKVSAIKSYTNVLHVFKSWDTTVLSIDTELTDINWLTMNIAGLSLCNGLKACYIDLLDNEERDDILELIKMQLSPQWGDTQEIIMHNAPFDLMVLKKYGIDLTGSDIFCTMTAAHLLDETQKKGLKVLAKKYLNIDDSDIMTFEEAVSKGFHSNRFYNYALDDAIWTWRLYEIFERMLANQNLEELFFNIEMPFQFCLMDMKINGALIDMNVLKGLRLQTQNLKDKLEKAMYGSANINIVETVPEVNIDSPVQLIELLQKLGVKLTEKTGPSKLHPKGTYSTAAPVLAKLVDQHEFVKLLLEYRSVNSLMSKFLKPLPEHVQEDGRIRCNFHNTVAVTGRLSSSKPNLQQLPKDNTGPLPLRQVIIPPKGYKLVCADYSGQELRVLAHVANDPAMIQAFNDGKDVHLMIANVFFELGIPDEELVESHSNYKIHRKKFKSQRDQIKTVNFGLAYGKTAFGFSKDWNIPVEEAQEFIDNYFIRFPKLKEAMDRCADELKAHKQISTILGRVRRFKQITNRAIRQGFNHLIQSPSADMMKAAAGNFREVMLRHPKWDSKLILSIHDELVYEVKEEYAEEMASRLKDIMESAVQLTIPVLVDVGIGDNYGESKV